MKASGLRNFRYVAFPPIVFDAAQRPVEEAPAILPEPAPGEPEWVLAPENEPPAPPAPMPALPPLAPHAEVHAAPVQPAAPVMAAAAPPNAPASALPQAAPEPIPDPPSWSRTPPPARPSGLRLLAEAAAAAVPPPPKPPGAPRRFALLDEISTEIRPRRARTGRRGPGDLL
ncbi:hypothetical protein EJV46_15520 [Roseococcus sp. SYP-B2431]|uniref:hypothetical protein n=1 Tax=Roseococcus sp. SYP-B2431 TaxID=2496640 RepID=UPI0010D5BC2F|nr:hypothetical protein [Roseococcus sp. SYP-B2431]TCH97534.1 hypothetical protein EJV46_15520 [Roseococcus sp. SYP-B2431]